MRDFCRVRVVEFIISTPLDLEGLEFAMGLKLGSGIRGQSTEQARQAQEVDAITTPLVEIIFPDSDNLSAYNAVFRHCPAERLYLGISCGNSQTPLWAPKISVDSAIGLHIVKTCKFYRQAIVATWN